MVLAEVVANFMVCDEGAGGDGEEFMDDGDGGHGDLAMVLAMVVGCFMVLDRLGSARVWVEEVEGSKQKFHPPPEPDDPF